MKFLATVRPGLAILFVAVMSAAEAQNNFSGVVTSSGAPVANARMTLFTFGLGQFFETRTGADGRYAFTNVPSGAYQIGAAALRYNYTERTTDTNDQTQVENFAIAPETEAGRWDIVGNTLPEFFDATDIGVLLGDGRIFFCHDTIDPVVFDPVTGTKFFPAGSGLPQGCMNGTVLQNGRVLFVGGDEPGNFRLAVRYVKTYDVVTNTWQRLPDLQEPNGRWYPGLTRLTDGRLLIMGGGTRPDAIRTNTCEIFNPGTNLCSYTGSMLNPCEFPPSTLLYNGDVLATYSPPQIYNVRSGQWRSTSNFIQPNRGYPGHADHTLVVLSDGRVLAVGIRGNATMGEIFNPITETWSLTSNPGLVRFQTEVVQLPDGKVLSAGGESTNPNPPVSNVLNIVKWCDLYDVTSDSWRRVADMHWFREYHAVTLLVPDGRVLMTGGTRIKFQYGPTSADIEAFVPPYLLRGVRPTIASLNATTLRPGAVISATITPATQITSVVLMGAGVTTHYVDGGVPRRLVLPVTQAGNTIAATLPKDPNLLPVGHYLFFAMVDDIPSVAKIVNVVRLQSGLPR